jgi:hypothetical protein
VDLEAASRGGVVGIPRKGIPRKEGTTLFTEMILLMAEMTPLMVGMTPLMDPLMEILLTAHLTEETIPLAGTIILMEATIAAETASGGVLEETMNETIETRTLDSAVRVERVVSSGSKPLSPSRR